MDQEDITRALAHRWYWKSQRTYNYWSVQKLDSTDEGYGVFGQPISITRMKEAELVAEHLETAYEDGIKRGYAEIITMLQGGMNLDEILDELAKKP